MKLLYITERQRNNASSDKKIYEVLCYEAQLALHEAVLRAIKRSLDPSSSALQIPPRQAGFMFFYPEFG